MKDCFKKWQYFYVVSMSEAGRISYFENYIDTLKKKDEAKEF
jgi:hypothetical protein